jgi:hypothetical protein
LNELCVGTTRLVCSSFAYVSVFVEEVHAPTDTTPPTFTVSGLEAEATGPTTIVNYTFNATDPDDAVVSQACTPAPGSSFALGSTTIGCTATDFHGNVGNETFAVVVSDRTAPQLTVPGSMTKEATSPAGAAVDFAVSATDAVDGALAPSCSKASGSTFPVGSTTVDCTVTDSHQNTRSASFVVVVSDTTAPTLTVPGPITVEATSPTGAVVTYTATANDVVDGPVTPNCSMPSGATFPLGSTTVNCTAADAHGNSSPPASFVVVVADTTPPVLSVPGAIVVAATSTAGAVVTYTATAIDVVDGPVTPTCSQPSGATFPAGTTIVSCTATDSHGNASATQTFTVRVEGVGAQAAAVLQEVLQRVLGWRGVRGDLPEELREVIAVVTKRSPRRACAELRDFEDELGGSLRRRLTKDQLAWLRGEISRVESMLGCSFAPDDRHEDDEHERK